MKIKQGKCPLCGQIGPLQRHHYIPKRVKKIDHYVYICEDCHKRIHPENEIIIRIKFLKEYHTKIKKFIKEDHPDVWVAWQPMRKELKEKFKKKVQDMKIPEIVDD